MCYIIYRHFGCIVMDHPNLWVARYHVMHMWRVKCKPIFLFHIPMFPIHYYKKYGVFPINSCVNV